jgi:TFIIF-interacting CTD phosphatase-like protein
VDNLRENFCRQPANGIEILTWLSDPYDQELKSLGEQLSTLLDNKEGRDVRDQLSKIILTKQ